MIGSTTSVLIYEQILLNLFCAILNESSGDDRSFLSSRWRQAAQNFEKSGRRCSLLILIKCLSLIGIGILPASYRLSTVCSSASIIALDTFFKKASKTNQQIDRYLIS
jgi:hypothetical protein